jgi:hypothetical protein
MQTAVGAAYLLQCYAASNVRRGVTSGPAASGAGVCAWAGRHRQPAFPGSAMHLPAAAPYNCFSNCCAAISSGSHTVENGGE